MRFLDIFRVTEQRAPCQYFQSDRASGALFIFSGVGRGHHAFCLFCFIVLDLVIAPWAIVDLVIGQWGIVDLVIGQWAIVDLVIAQPAIGFGDCSIGPLWIW